MYFSLFAFSILNLATTVFGYSDLDNSIYGHTITVSNLCPYDINCRHQEILRVKESDPDVLGIFGSDMQLKIREKGIFFELPSNFEVGLECAKASDIDSPAELKWIYNTTAGFSRIGFLITNLNTGFSQPPPQDNTWRSCWDVRCPAGVECDALQVDWKNDDGSDRESAYPLRVCPDTVLLLWNICGANDDHQPRVVEDHDAAAIVG